MFGQSDDNQQQTDNNPFGAAPAPAPFSPIDTQAAPVDDAGLGNESTAPAMPDPLSSPVSGAPVADDSPAAPAPGSDDLLQIKQEALQHLTPLVGHLDQSPEEKFRTTMMMIQATDDQSLLKGAYETAKQITDEKVRAQALLDVVNEINYFTQQHNK
jgi:hypothetical protein